MCIRLCSAGGTVVAPFLVCTLAYTGLHNAFWEWRKKNVIATDIDGLLQESFRCGTEPGFGSLLL